MFYQRTRLERVILIPKALVFSYLLLHFGDMMFDTTELSRLWAIPNPSIITESENEKNSAVLETS